MRRKFQWPRFWPLTLHRFPGISSGCLRQRIRGIIPRSMVGDAVSVTPIRFMRPCAVRVTISLPEAGEARALDYFLSKGYQTARTRGLKGFSLLEQKLWLMSSSRWYATGCLGYPGDRSTVRSVPLLSLD